MGVLVPHGTPVHHPLSIGIFHETIQTGSTSQCSSRKVPCSLDVKKPRRSRFVLARLVDDEWDSFYGFLIGF